MKILQKYLLFFLFFLLFGLLLPRPALAQDDNIDEEIVRYFQMETMDDSLFVKIQEEMKIDPPNPKAEIVVDLRDAQNQTVTIQGSVYPYLAFTPEIRARIMTFPFKMNLEEQTGFGSVFTRVLKKIKLRKLAEPPRHSQILASRAYVNPYLSVFGGERLGIPVKKDIGLSLGSGTPYSGPLESDQLEVNLHMLGAFGGIVFFDPMLIGKASLEQPSKSDSGGGFSLNSGNRMHLMYALPSLQVGYVIPLGNFLEVSYQRVLKEIDNAKARAILKDSAGGYYPLVMTGSYFNWEFRYPFRSLGSTRSKLYVASYQKEIHIGYVGREMALVGSNFDLRMDYAIPYGAGRRSNQFMLECLVSKIAESWATSAVAIGPAIIVGMNQNRKVGINTLFLNIRFKLGSSL